MDTKQSPVKDACQKHLQNGVQQFRYNLKKKFFDERPLCEVPTKSPARNMTDDEWRDLIEHWKDPRNMVSLLLNIEVVVFYMHMYSVY